MRFVSVSVYPFDTLSPVFGEKVISPELDENKFGGAWVCLQHSPRADTLTVSLGVR